ncbi:uncharacterized protein LOC127804011 isoform X2 [Diospyros lotus]|uniref:uncharacterized protein LOC127804011 isoform X2 n=1 Tax=Diospyros lotus TaxID=55363 RepID=UPI00224CEDA5|nr:uncharacterized protein LOC127804011 isoform X2 [Diospyros lotus]
MRRRSRLLETPSLHCLFSSTAIAVFLQVLGAASVAVPSSNCYALDNSSHIYDFSSWIGHVFEYDGGKGYVDFGRFDHFNYFVAGSGHASFVQEFYGGDLRNCEHTYDKMGRTAQVNIICGNCSDRYCKGELGCICNVTYESTCRVLVELAIACEKQGPQVFEGFTVGFHPRSWELVYNGLTQMGYEKSHHEFSFKTEQTHVALYMTAIASLSTLVQKPTFKISPEHGLEVKLSGSGASGRPPTTLSPTILMVDWRCEKARNTPYEVEITIPVKGYDSIQFTLTKMCEYIQHKEGEAMHGWAIFGVISCTLIVSTTLFCSGGFVYNTQVQNRHGLDALPGMTIVSACLETVSKGGHNYSHQEDINSPFVNQVSWERPPVPAQGPRRTTNERRYGAI